jgi:hypothetical protein
MSRRLVPAVLGTEPQFRLLFAGRVLSLVGDRVMLVALPFAVLEAGGSLQAVGLVVAASSCRSCCSRWSAACSRTAATGAGC